MALACEVRGAGEPVVLLPMFGLDHVSMTVAFEPLLGDFQRVYADLPGTGSSAPVDPSSDSVLDAVLELLDGLGGAHLVGASYGGYLAIGAARRRPDLVRSLLLVCTGTRILVADRNVPAGPGPEAEPGWLSDVPPELHSHLEAAVGHRTAAVAGRIAGLIAAARTDDEYLDRLRSSGYQLSDEEGPGAYAGPVLMICGREDRVAGYTDQFTALSRYPDGMYAAVPRAGHYLPYEQPEVFQALVRDWVRALRPGT